MILLLINTINTTIKGLVQVLRIMASGCRMRRINDYNRIIEVVGYNYSTTWYVI